MYVYKEYGHEVRLFSHWSHYSKFTLVFVSTHNHTFPGCSERPSPTLPSLLGVATQSCFSPAAPRKTQVHLSRSCHFVLLITYFVCRASMLLCGLYFLYSFKMTSFSKQRRVKEGYPIFLTRNYLM